MNKFVRWTIAGSAAAIAAIAVARAQTVDGGVQAPLLFPQNGASTISAPATTEGQLPAPALPSPPREAAATGTPVDPSATRQQVVRLSDLGRPDGLELKGPLWQAGLRFTVRRDDAVVAARLNLAISTSPAVARQEGELAIYLNDERIASLPIGRAKGARPRSDVVLNPVLLRTENRLRFALNVKGRAAESCRSPADGTYWLRIEPATFIFLSATRLPIADDLAVLPRPFVDPTDPVGAVVPFVLPAGADPAVLQAAGTIASWFGAANGERGLRVPVTFDALPPANAVILVVGDAYPAGVAAIAGNGPRVALVTNPLRPDSKLLIVVGDTAEQLSIAAATLALQSERPSGSTAEAGDTLPPPRMPYDAPRWLPTDRPVRLGDIVDGTTLGGSALLDGITVPFGAAPDLYFGSRQGGHLNLRVLRSADSWIDAAESRVSIDFNRKNVDEAPMVPRLKVLSRLREYFFPGSADDRVARVLLAESRLEAEDRLAFRFDLRAKPATDCAALEWSAEAGIDPESTIDLRGAAHFARLPDLALFARSGFPFTRLADLAGSAVVVSDSPSTEEIQAMLEILALFGRETGLPASRHVVTRASDLAGVADRHLLVIGTSAGQPLLRKWEAYGPLAATSTDWLGSALRLLHPFEGAMFSSRPDIAGAKGFLKAHTGKPLAWLATFASPLNGERVAVTVAASEANQLPDLSGRLADAQKRLAIRGDLFLSSGQKSESYTSGRQQAVGHLPLWQRVQWFAQSLGVLVFGIVPVAVGFFAVAVRHLGIDRARALLRRGERHGVTSPSRDTTP